MKPHQPQAYGLKSQAFPSRHSSFIVHLSSFALLLAFGNAASAQWLLDGRKFVTATDPQAARNFDTNTVYQTTNGNFTNTVLYNETLPNGVTHPIIEISDSFPQDNTPVYTVPEDHFFAMGDNRDNSRDSRFLMDVGFIPKENLVGRAEMLFFSIDGSFWKVWTWPWSVRFERFFTGVN